MTWTSFAWRIGLLCRLHTRRLRAGWLLWRRRHRRRAPTHLLGSPGRVHAGSLIRRQPSWPELLGGALGGATGLGNGVGSSFIGCYALSNTGVGGYGGDPRDLQGSIGLSGLAQQQAMRGMLVARDLSDEMRTVYEHEMQLAVRRQRLASLERVRPGPFLPLS
jgi:hypothetical protein